MGEFESSGHSHARISYGTPIDACASNELSAPCENAFLLNGNRSRSGLISDARINRRFPGTQSGCCMSRSCCPVLPSHRPESSYAYEGSHPVTVTLRNKIDNRPRLEFYPVNSSTLRTVVIEDYPFVIGRGEDTQLKINSTSMSREHARLTKTTEGLRLEDMESTNGTEVNGVPIGDVLLEDGDTIRIAELEITFRCATSKPSAMAQMATQPLPSKKRNDQKSEVLDVLWSQRALSEALLWQTIPLCHTRVVDSQVAAQQATFVSIGEPIASQISASAYCDLYSSASRVQQLAWMVAARHADDISTAGTLCLRYNLHSGLDHRLCQTFELAKECLSSDRPLGVILPWVWAVESPQTIELCAELKASGAELVFDAFTGGASCVDSMQAAPPDLLVLAKALARGIPSNRHRKKHLEQIVSSCSAAGIRLVLPAGLTESEYQECHDLGVELIVRENEKPENAHGTKAVAITV